MLIIIGIVGAIIIGALLVYGILVAPARQPYRDAYDQYKSVGRANALLTATGSSLNANAASDADFEKSIQTAQAALTSLRTENEALGKEAVLTTGEGKTLYDAFNAKLQPYMTYNDELLTSMLKVRPALYRCNQDMTNISADAASVQAIRSCVSRLQSIGDIPNDDYQTLVSALVNDYTKLATTIEEMAALPDPKGADASRNTTLGSDRDQILDNLSSDSATFTKNLQAHRGAVLTTNVADTLSQYLQAKSRIF
jgi:hypothetical protein